jgi:hypothetical protein
MEEIFYLLSNPAMPEIFMILKTTNEDPIKTLQNRIHSEWKQQIHP